MTTYSDPGQKMNIGNETNGFNISNMLATLGNSGVAISSHFEVQIVGVDATTLEKDLVYRAESCTLPGRNLMTVDHKFTNYGPVNKVPYASSYLDSTVTFIMSEDLREKAYFELWHERMVSTGCMGGEGRPRTFNVKYFDEYKGTVLIRQFGSSGELRSIHRLIDAFPIQMAEVGMAWAEDSPLKLSVTFTYRYYDAIFNNEQQPGLGFGVQRTIPNLFYGGSVSRLLDTMNRSTAIFSSIKSVVR